MEGINETVDFAAENWPVIAGLVYEVASRVVPTKKNLSLIDNIVKVIGIILKNRRRPQPDDLVGRDDATNKVFVRRDRHIIPVLLALFLPALLVAQTNPTNTQALRLVNVNDSTTVTSNPATTQIGNFTMFYNKQSAKPRMYYGGIGYDIGSGNLSGNLTTPRIPYATGTKTLSTVANFYWDNTQKRMVVANNAGTQNTYLFGGQITLDEPSTGDNVVMSVGNGGVPYIVVDDGLNAGRLDADGVTGGNTVEFTISNSANLNVRSQNGDVDISTLNSTKDIALNAGNMLDLYAVNGPARLRSDDIQLVDPTGTFGWSLDPTTGTATVSQFIVDTGAGTGAIELNTVGGTGNIDLKSGVELNIQAADSTSIISNSTNYVSFKAGLVKLATDPGNDFIFQGSDGAPGVDPPRIYVQGGNGPDNGGSVLIRSGSGASAEGSIDFNAGAATITLNGASGNIDLLSNDFTFTGIAFQVNGYDVFKGLAQNYTIDYPNTASLGEQLSVQTLTGASTGETCIVTSPFSSGGVWTCRVSASNTITIIYHNTTSAAVDPSSGTYRVMVVK